MDVPGGVTAMDYPETALDVSYTYDDPLVPFSKGRLTAITRDGATVSYRYDRFGRTTQDGGLTIGYDANGNRTSVRFPRKATGFTQSVTALSTFDYADREVALSYQEGTGIPVPLAAAAAYRPFARSQPSRRATERRKRTASTAAISPPRSRSPAAGRCSLGTTPRMMSATSPASPTCSIRTGAAPTATRISTTS